MRYEYGVQRMQPPGAKHSATESVLDPLHGRVEIAPTKAVAEEIARDYVISPLRTGLRKARTVRRSAPPRGSRGLWEALDTWTTPESAQ